MQSSEMFIPDLSRSEEPDDSLHLADDLTAKSSDSTSKSSAFTPLVPQRDCSFRTNSVKVDKLNIQALSLCGRDQEIDVLNKALEQLSSGVVERHLILVSGESGTGKSALANSLKTSKARQVNGLFVRGKFDFNNIHEPYSAIVGACNEICDHISLQNKILLHIVTERIKEELGSELSLLLKFIPALKGVMEWKDDDPSSEIVGSSSEKARNRFHFSFLRFMRIISDEFPYLLLVLDDLQWADVSSLELLEICLSDLDIKKLMIIGTYRSSEVYQTHVLHDSIDRFKIKCEQSVFKMTKLTIENLDVDGVNEIIGMLLSMDDEATTMGLARVCFKKTQGNPFYVLQYLQMLRNSGLLTYNFGSFSWKWNIKEIESSTNSTSNVVDLLKAKMEHLPTHLLEILKIAACLGSTFNGMCLMTIWEYLSSMSSLGEGEPADFLMSGLKQLARNGYIIRRRCGASSLVSSQFSWTHDKIREAAIMLIPMTKRPAFFRDAGDILLSSLDKASRESTIFVIANLVNAGEELVDNDNTRLILARLNHDASLRALSISAFKSVADYTKKGIKFLPENHWNDHYELSLGLYSIAAQAEGFLGNTELMQQYCNVVLSQNEKPLRDKIWVYHTLVNSLMARGQREEAASILFNVLARCNCQFPKSPVTITIGLIQMSVKIKAVVKSLKPEELAPSEKPMMVELMQLLDRLASCLYLTKDSRLPLVLFRILDWTLKHGHTDYSSVAFAFTGIVLIRFLYDYSGATRFGETALKLVDKSESCPTRSRTMFTVHALVFVWTKPITQVLKPLLLSYNEGLKSGDKESAASSIFFELILRFMIGTPLQILVKNIHLYSTQMKEWKMETVAASLVCFHQNVLKIIGNTESNSLVMSEEDYLFWSQDLTISPMVFVYEGAHATYFGDHVQNAIKAIQHGHDYIEKQFPGICTIPFNTFLSGVSCFAAARETGKRKFLKAGERLRSKIRRWRELGNPNVLHYESFLDAESAALKNQKNDAIMHYETAIIRAGRTGFLQDVALASERLAEFYLKVMGDKEEAKYRLEQSLGYWREWGALAKVEALEKRYFELFHVSVSGVFVMEHAEEKEE